MQKKHSSPVGLPTLLMETLAAFMEKGLTADRALNETFRHYKIRDEEQRAELALRFYGIIRFWRPLVTALGEDQFDNLGAVKRLIGAWNAWKKIYKGEKQDNLTGPVAERLEKYARIRKLRESFPDWLDAFAVEQLGEHEWTQLAAALNKDPKLQLRVNSLRASREQVLGALSEAGIEAYPHAELPDCIRVKVYANVFALPAFHDGLFEVQDSSSQRVSLFLGVQPGMRVADACAGNGGKTLHLAALMRNRGKIVAMDVAANKLDELRARCTRNGVDLVETRVVEHGKVPDAMKETFDRVLLDVPCTGTGVLRRNPDIRWRLYPEDVERLQKEQEEILVSYATLVKAGGMLVFATCSVLPCEGEDQVQRFLSANTGSWEKEEELRTNPISDDGDGFYMARLKRII